MMNVWQLTPENFLSEDEVRQLLASLRTAESTSSDKTRSAATMDRVIIESLLFSGLRSSEFCGLLLRDTSIGLGQPALRVAGTRQNDRTVYIPAELDELIVRYVREVRPDRLLPGVDPEDMNQPLVLNDRRRPYERTALYRRVVRILEQAGLGSRASVQLLRHTYGYLAYKRSGGNLLFVQEQLGHAHPMVTAVYAELVQFDYAALADGVAAESSSPPLTPGSHERTNRKPARRGRRGPRDDRGLPRRRTRGSRS